MTPLTSEVLAEGRDRQKFMRRYQTQETVVAWQKWLEEHARALLAAAERLLEMESEKPKAQATIIDTHIQGLRRVRNEHGSGPTPELDARIEALESLQAENAALRAEVERLKERLKIERAFSLELEKQVGSGRLHRSASTPPATGETE